MVKWKNQDLKEYGIIVEKTPSISKAKKKTEIIQIDGRNGFLSIDSGTYEPFNLPIECHCSDEANIDAIKAFLDGFGTLSFDDEKEYTAVINNTIPFEKIFEFKKFIISFLVNPIAEDINDTTIDLTEEDSFEIDTYASIYPILTIECEGSISVTINNQTFYLNDTDGTYTLDCKNKIITDENDLNASNKMLYDFPSFKPGTNTIDYVGNITSIVATYKKTYL